jgi:3-oxoadipate CoA-transferase, beta subunit
LPTMVADFLPSNREVVLQSENGILGMGPAPISGQEDPDLINAGKEPVTLLPGGCFFYHGDCRAPATRRRGGAVEFPQAL